MFNWRNAIALTVIFGIVGIIYWFGWYNFFPPGTDYTGFVLLLMLMVTVIYNDLTRVEWIEKLMPWR